MRFVDVTNDVAFRKIFGDQVKTKSLISFLNAALKLEGDHRVESVTIMNPFQLPRIGGEKATIIDVKATDQAGRNFIVEMQVPSVTGFAKRVQYYAFRDYSLQINKGEDYELLKPTYFIGILDFKFSKGDDYLSHHLILNEITYEHLLTDIRFTFIELPKFNKGLDDLESTIDQWVFFLKNAENLDLVPENIVDEGLLEAWEKAERHSWTKAEYQAYDDMSIAEADQRNMLKFALEQGKIDANRAGIVKSLLRGKLSLQEIAEDFGVSMGYVEEINDSLSQSHEGH